MIKLTGLHILLTYTCNVECDHCFVWGSPRQEGVMDADRLSELLEQAERAGGIREIWFEGGEPFLYFPILLAGVAMAHGRGFTTGVVTNAYWASASSNARHWLEPLAIAGLDEIAVSADAYHGTERSAAASEIARDAAASFGVRCSTIAVTPGEAIALPADWFPGMSLTGGEVMYRGRAAALLAPAQPLQPWTRMPFCPYEDLADPGRVHVDPMGNVHVCQGILIGNVFHDRLGEILRGYEPSEHPIAGPLLAGGPKELIKTYHLRLPATFADACHACYQARVALRERFPEYLGPDAMYGIFNGNTVPVTT